MPPDFHYAVIRGGRLYSFHFTGYSLDFQPLTNVPQHDNWVHAPLGQWFLAYGTGPHDLCLQMIDGHVAAAIQYFHKKHIAPEMPEENVEW
jgi:hypothetical protein